MKTLLKARVGNTLYTRQDQFHAWLAQTWQSIGLAKKANGLDSREFGKVTELPKNMNRRTSIQQRFADRREEAVVAVTKDLRVLPTRRVSERRK